MEVCKGNEVRMGNSGWSKLYNEVSFIKSESQLLTSLAYNLRYSRCSLKLSQEKCAQMMGVSRTQYRRYENGEVFPRLYKGINWSLSTGIPIEWLFYPPPSPYEPHNTDMRLTGRWLPLVSLLNLATPKNMEYLTVTLSLPTILVDEIHPDVNNSKQRLDEAQFYRRLNEDLRWTRNDLGASQFEMSALMGVCETTYQTWESENSTAVPLSVFMILGMLGKNKLFPFAHSHPPFYQYYWRQQRIIKQLEKLKSISSAEQQLALLNKSIELFTCR